jgi:hypothetical protein
VPTLFMLNGFRFFFFSHEENRMHIHVEYQGRKAKIWLDNFEVAQNDGFYLFEINQILKITRMNEKAFKKAWISHFGKKIP